MNKQKIRENYIKWCNGDKGAEFPRYLEVNGEEEGTRVTVKLMGSTVSLLLQGNHKLMSDVRNTLIYESRKNLLAMHTNDLEEKEIVRIADEYTGARFNKELKIRSNNPWLSPDSRVLLDGCITQAYIALLEYEPT